MLLRQKSLIRNMLRAIIRQTTRTSLDHVKHSLSLGFLILRWRPLLYISPENHADPACFGLAMARLATPPDRSRRPYELVCKSLRASNLSSNHHRFTFHEAPSSCLKSHTAQVGYIRRQKGMEKAKPGNLH